MAGVNDWLGTLNLAKQGIPTGQLNLYVLSMQGMKSMYSSITDTKTTVINIPPVDRIISCYFLPYVDYNDCLTVDVDYDEQAFPLPYNTGDDSIKNYTVTRLNGLGASGLKVVGTFNKFEISGTSIGGAYNWRNESKLWGYPFTQMIAHDNISEPFIINPYLIKTELPTFDIICRNSLNHLGKYTLYVDGYRGMSQGQLYGQTMTGASMPVISSNYTSYLNQEQFNIRNERFHNLTNLLTGLTKDPLGAISSSIVGYGDSKLGEVNALMSGYTLSNQGSDGIHDLQMFGGMTVSYQQPREEMMEKMGRYFHQYGYAQNKVMNINYKNRKYWNYIKTQDVKLTITDAPKSHVNQMKDIFNNGVTIWHYDNGMMFEHMNSDNVEFTR